MQPATNTRWTKLAAILPATVLATLDEPTAWIIAGLILIFIALQMVHPQRRGTRPR